MKKVSFTIRNIDGETVLQYLLKEDEQIDNYAMAQLERGDIGAALRIEKRVDLNRTMILIHNNGRTPFSEWLMKAHTGEEILGGLQKLLEALREIESAGISIGNLVLHKQFVYRDHETGKLSFICIPVKQETFEYAEIPAFVRMLITNIIYMQEEDMNYVGQLLAYLNGGSPVSIQGMLGLVAQLRRERQGENEAEDKKKSDVDVEPAALEKEMAEPVIIEETTAEPVVIEEAVAEPGPIAVEAPMVETEPVALVMPVETEFVRVAGSTDRDIDACGTTEHIVREEAESGEKEVHLGNTGMLTNIKKPIPYLLRKAHGEMIYIQREEFHIGKSVKNMDYVVKDNPAVSRSHCTIYMRNGVYYIHDNKSTNHTYVNGKQVDLAEDVLLTHNASVVMGDEEFIFMLR